MKIQDEVGATLLTMLFGAIFANAQFRTQFKDLFLSPCNAFKVVWTEPVAYIIFKRPQLASVLVAMTASKALGAPLFIAWTVIAAAFGSLMSTIAKQSGGDQDDFINDAMEISSSYLFD